MEDLVGFLNSLKHSEAIIQKLIHMLEEDKQNISRGMSGEAEKVYKQQCDRAIEKMKNIQHEVRVLYSVYGSES